MGYGEFSFFEVDPQFVDAIILDGKFDLKEIFKEEKKRKILKQVKDKNQLWFLINQKRNQLIPWLVKLYQRLEILSNTLCNEFLI